VAAVVVGTAAECLGLVATFAPRDRESLDLSPADEARQWVGICAWEKWP